MLNKRGLKSIRTTKVANRADDEIMGLGVVKQIDKDGSHRADEPADLDRRHVGAHIMDARKMFSQTCHFVYPVVHELQRFFIAVARVFVDNDDKEGTIMTRKERLLIPVSGLPAACPMSATLTWL